MSEHTRPRRTPSFYLLALPLITLAAIIGCGGSGGGSSTGTGTTTGTTSSTTGGSQGTGSSTTGTASTGTSATGATTGATTTGGTTTGGTTTGGTTTGGTTTGGTTTGGTTTGSTTTGGTTTGGSTTGSSTTGGTTSTGTTTGSTTGTTTGGGTTGSTGGSFVPGNAVIFNYGDPTNIQVDYVNPDGTGDTHYFNFNSQTLVATPNPSANTFAFAYASNPAVQAYDVYSNTRVNATGATKLTNSGFAFIFSLQYTTDGTKIVFVAQTQLGANNLYVMSANGSNLVAIDAADDAYVAADGQSICYTKSDVNQNGQIWTATVAGANITQITNDAWDHFGPQFSKDVAHLAWTAAPNGTSYDVYSATATGTGVTQITNANGDNAVSPSWSPDGSKLAYVLEASSNTALTGIYTVSAAGAGSTQIVTSPLANSGLFWTNANGYLLGGRRMAEFVGRSYHVIRLRRRGFHIR